MDNSKIEIMENFPVKQAILKLSLPTMLSMAVVLIYNLTDTFFIGRLNDPNLVAALAIASPVFMSIQAIGNIFANGASSYVSRKLGEKDYAEAKKTTAVSVYTSIIVGVVITALLLLFRGPLLAVIGTSPATIGPTSDYYSVVSAFSIVFILQITFMGLTRSEGATDKAMVGTILGIVINIILDPIMIFVMDMGVGGAAWATAIGTTIGSLYFLFHLVSKKTLLSIHIHYYKPSRKIFGEVFKIGIPSALSNIVMSLSFILVNILAAGYGDHVVAGNGIQFRVAGMAFMLLMGLAQGYQPFAGYNYGAKKYDRLMEGFKYTLIYATSLGVFFFALFFFFGEGLIRIFINDAATIEVGAKILRAFCFAIPFIGLQMTMMVTFQSTGKALSAMIVSLGRQCIIYLPALLILNRLFGFNGFIYAQPLADILTTVVAVLLSRSFFREMRGLHENLEAAGESERELLAVE